MSWWTFLTVSLCTGVSLSQKAWKSGLNTTVLTQQPPYLPLKHWASKFYLNGTTQSVKGKKHRSCEPWLLWSLLSNGLCSAGQSTQALLFCPQTKQWWIPLCPSPVPKASRSCRGSTFSSLRKDVSALLGLKVSPRPMANHLSAWAGSQGNFLEVFLKERWCQRSGKGRQSYLGNQHGFTTPTKKNNNTDGKIRVGNKEHSAVTTGTAQNWLGDKLCWDLHRGKRGLGTSGEGEMQWESPAALSVVLGPHSRWHCGIPMGRRVLGLTQEWWKTPPFPLQGVWSRLLELKISLKK